MHDLTAFQRDLLYVVSSLEKPHGLAIKDRLDAYYDSEIHHGRLYPNLDELTEKGLLNKGKADKRTNWYDLTDRSTRELEARRDWEDQHLQETVRASA